MAGLTFAIVPSPAQAAPANDGFAARTVVGVVPYQDAQITTDATTEPGEPQPRCGEIEATLWYEYTPPSDTVLSASTFGSDYDTMIGVWTGASLGSLTEVACDDNTPVRFTSIVAFAAHGGTTYFFQVGGTPGDFPAFSGSLSFRVREVDAAFISGRVTEEGTGVPLPQACVAALDADLGSAVRQSTDANGNYNMAVRSGSYTVEFSDCADDIHDHNTEWYEEAADPGDADEVTVSAPEVITDIDGTLTRSCPSFADAGFPQFLGTPGPDVLTGGPEAEIFCGFGGDDRINGGGGYDFIMGGAGRDRLSGGSGLDFLEGNEGRDRITGGAGQDFPGGGAGRDEISGGGGDDFLAGGADSDGLRGGDGDDYIRGGAGDDVLVGGPGEDDCRGGKGDRRRSCE